MVSCQLFVLDYCQLISREAQCIGDDCIGNRRLVTAKIASDSRGIANLLGDVNQTLFAADAHLCAHCFNGVCYLHILGS